MSVQFASSEIIFRNNIVWVNYTVALHEVSSPPFNSKVKNYYIDFQKNIFIYP